MYQEYLNQLNQSIAPLSSEELKDLLNDEEKIDEKVDEVLEILKAQKNSLLEENRGRAERNLDKEPQIIELRGKISELLATTKQSCEVVQEKLTLIKDKSGNVSQDTALALLQAASAESEEESETLVQKFTDKEASVEDFLETFLAARKTMHLRKLKVEKMQELMRRQRSNAAGVPAYSNMPGSGFYPSVPCPYPTGAGGGVPYPLGPMMPMPPQRPY